MKYRALLAIAFVVTIHQPVQMQHERPLSYSIEDFYSDTQFRDASFSPFPWRGALRSR